MNISPKEENLEKIAEAFYLLGHPSRLQILLIIGKGEACVCHIKDALNKRQAYISQQLMLLKQSNLVTHRRVGRNLYYRLVDPDLLKIIEDTANHLNIKLPNIEVPDIPGCPYYACVSDNSPKSNAPSES